ncbi:MAG TPA: PPC domain-containing DNA-binding protein [Casimicrobiaceae bacterium]|nr:PPC domain-containing DNA-binding protein [Casimicrobiaceae bacterium]
MEALPLRLTPGADLRAALEAALGEHSQRAAVVISGIGSLSSARVRLAGASEPTQLRGDLEILTLAGTVGSDGAHLHMTVADSAGRVMGGHVARGCIVRTTAEVALLLLPGWSFNRELDPATGFAELVISRRAERPA